MYVEKVILGIMALHWAASWYLTKLVEDKKINSFFAGTVLVIVTVILIKYGLLLILSLTE